MTDESRRANVAAEVARAVECMESAEILLAAGARRFAESAATLLRREGWLPPAAGE